MKSTFFSFRVNGRHAGLVRRREAPDYLSLAYVDQGAWVEKGDLLRHWVNPDGTLEEVSQEEAEHLASILGVTLDADAVREI